MGDLKKWVQNNWSTAILTVFFVVILVNTDARAWLMRQVASTGLLNSGISESKAGEVAISYHDFTVKNEAGIPTNTSDLRGKVVFINFWASWCPPCRAEFPSIQKLYDKYRSHPDMVFLTINLDDDQALGKAYLKEKGFNIPFLTPSGNIPKEIYDGSLPTTVVLDKQGTIRLRHTGVADYSKDSFYADMNALLK